MRILLLIPALSGAGAERQLAYLAGELQHRGHDVLVGYLQPGAGSWPDGIPTHRFTRRAPWSERLIRDIVRLMRAWKPDVVQTCITRMDVAGGIAAAFTRVPHVLREPNTAAAYRNAFKERLRRLDGRHAAAIVANTDDGAAYWSHPRTFVIPNAVPFDEIAGIEPIARDDDTPLLLYAGRLEPEKNVDIVLRAFARVAAERPLRLIVCGNGPERARLEALTRELGIDDRARFAGFVQDVWRYERAADVALLVSSFEGHPNVISECFAAGTPMILSDIAPHRALSGGGALLVPPRDVDATAAAIRQVLDDPITARERANYARERVGEISVSRMAAAYEDVYAVAVGAPATRHP